MTRWFSGLNRYGPLDRFSQGNIPGFVGADLANLVNEAALLAARKGKNAVELADFDAAIDRIVAGLEKKTRVMNLKEKETVEVADLPRGFCFAHWLAGGRIG
jgi:ATP-dependent Zn protease